MVKSKQTSAAAAPYYRVSRAATGAQDNCLPHLEIYTRHGLKTLGASRVPHADGVALATVHLQLGEPRRNGSDCGVEGIERGGDHGFGAEGCTHSVRHFGVEPARRERARSRRRPRGRRGKGREALTCCEGIVGRGMFCLVQEAEGVNRCMQVRARGGGGGGGGVQAGARGGWDVPTELTEEAGRGGEKVKSWRKGWAQRREGMYLGPRRTSLISV